MQQNLIKTTNILKRKGKLTEAIAQYRQLIKSNPSFYCSYYNLGDLLAQTNHLTEAIAQYQNALEISPNSAFTHYRLGEALLKQGSLKEAISSFQNAIKIKSNFHKFHNGLGKALAKQGQWDNAAKCFQKAIALQPNSCWAYYNLGEVLSKQKKWEKAVIQYQEAIRLNPCFSRSHLDLGEALIQVGELDAAISKYRKAIELDPNILWPYIKLGEALTAIGKEEEAIAAYTKAAHLNQNKYNQEESHWLYYQLGQIFCQKEMLREALICFQKSINSQARQPLTIYAYLAESPFVNSLSNLKRRKKNSIFISALYRTGSSFLYSMLSNAKNVTAFYEPLNEALIDWLNKNEQESQNNKLIYSHTFKGKYFDDYKDIDINILSKIFKRNFGLNKVVMSSSDEFYELKAYIEYLMSFYKDKLKVFKFNRINFRLGWFKINFPNSIIVDLRRNPRDIYASYINVYENKNKKKFNKNDYLGNLFYLDYYIECLGKISKPQFCPYELNNYEKIYLLDRFSNMWSDRFADMIVEYESLIENPLEVASQIVSSTDTFQFQIKEDFIQPKKCQVGNWRKYQSESWFKQCEARCESLIETILSVEENIAFDYALINAKSLRSDRKVDEANQNYKLKLKNILELSSKSTTSSLTHKRLYLLGTKIDFALGGNADKYLKNGWSRAEEWGRWTVGLRAELKLELTEEPTDDLILRIKGKPYISEGRTEARVGIELSKKSVGEVLLPGDKITTTEFKLPHSMISGTKILELSLHTPDHRKPKADDTDRREHAFSVYSILINS